MFIYFLFKIENISLKIHIRITNTVIKIIH